jgi:hypothetical protein
MITTKNVTVYKCEHCGKKLFRKHAMEKHEKFCYRNPANRHICFEGCEYLKREDIKDECGGGPVYRRVGFTCTKLKKPLYSYVAEKRGLLERFPDDFDDCERMPLECPHYSNPMLGDMEEYVL